MKIIWEITTSDVEKVHSFYEKHKNNTFVKTRLERNVKGNHPPVTKEAIWKNMVFCLLTTQQLSGPSSAVNRFSCAEPCLVEYSVCVTQKDLRAYITDTLKTFGGIRRYDIIAEEVSNNYRWLENGGWPSILDLVDKLQSRPTLQLERESANFIDDRLKGFGPKQARNLLQSLCITKYEIPLDSRVIKWVNDFGFPIKLTAGNLSDRDYYIFVEDGIQLLCKQSDIYPCMLDAAIFSSYDPEWSEDQMW